jgi:hypothetical protein
LAEIPQNNLQDDYTIVSLAAVELKKIWMGKEMRL